MKLKGLAGFRDFYAEEIALKNTIFAAWREVARRYGFQEYDGPPLESLEMYTRKSGVEIVDQLYNFRDKGDREISLRPEMTPTLARMVTARATQLKKPIRWFSMPQLFRYERQQRGRLREHFQLNMDVIGEPGPMADSEIIAAALDITRYLGMTAADIRVRMSDRRVIQELLVASGVESTYLGAVYRAVDKIDRESRDKLLEGLVQAGLDRSVAERALDLGKIRGMDALQSVCREVNRDSVADDLGRCVDYLSALGFAEFIEIDLSIVRGLDYYTGIVFELFDAGRSLRAVCGGGRYDGLLEALGGVDLPAVGFGMGDVVLGELLKDRGWTPDSHGGLDAFLIAVTSEDVPTMLGMVRTLRERGVSVEYGMKRQAVGKQLKIADARRAKFACIVGPEERAVGAVVVREMDTGEERTVLIDQVNDLFPMGDEAAGRAVKSVASGET